MINTIDKLHHKLIRFNAISISSLFERLSSSTAKLSKDLKKLVNFGVASSIPDVYFPSPLFDSLWDITYQVLKNAIDHGIETEEERKLNHKPLVAMITIEVGFESNDELFIKIRDDGKGISNQKIIKTALNKKLISKKEAENFLESDNKEAYNILFIPSFTTQENVTTLSGRGVGLDVINKEIKNFNGKISIDSKLEQWTEFTVKLPITSNHILIDSHN